MALDDPTGDSVVIFWHALTRAERTSVRDSGARRAFRAGTIVIHEGDGTDDVVVVLSGWVKVTARDPDGYESLLAARGPGDIVGEMAALLPMPRTAEVRAIRDIEVIRMRKASFESLLLREPGVALALLKVLVSRLRHADRWRARCGSLTVDRRVEILLSELISHHGPHAGAGTTRLPLPFSQEELAGFVAGSRKSVCRALRRLRADGIVETGRRAVACQRDGTTGLPRPRGHQSSMMMFICSLLLVNPTGRGWRRVGVVVGGGRTLLR